VNPLQLHTLADLKDRFLDLSFEPTYLLVRSAKPPGELGIQRVQLSTNALHRGLTSLLILGMHSRCGALGGHQPRAAVGDFQRAYARRTLLANSTDLGSRLGELYPSALEFRTG
jgi:hypothetical protein